MEAGLYTGRWRGRGQGEGGGGSMLVVGVGETRSGRRRADGKAIDCFPLVGEGTRQGRGKCGPW
jgi:hypothetical protein